MAQFQQLCAEALASITVARRVVILVGGTGLYVRSVVDRFTTPGRFPEVAAELASESDTEVLHRRLRLLDPAAAAKMEPTNRRRILRALEVTIGSGRRFSSFGPGVDHYGPTPYVQIGLDLDRAGLDARIEARYDRQLAGGFLDEVRALPAGLSRTAAQALGYRELLEHIRGQQTLEAAMAEAKQRTRRFARRQQRWFRRDPRIHWIDATAPDLVDRAEQLWAEQSENQVWAGRSRCETGSR